MANELSLDSLSARAVEVAGTDDWGDRGALVNLELLVGSVLRTGDLNETGRRVLRSVCVRHLANRLLVNAYVADHPETDDWPVGPALVVTGIPRTGTTLLHNLLACDPGNRFLRFWEALRPVPPDPSTGPSEDGLKASAAAWLDALYRIVPEFRTIHGATAEGPEECDTLLQNEFASQHFDDMFNAEEYSDWFNGADLTSEYGFYALQLRLLRRPGDQRPWALKSPSHVGHLDALLAVMPEAIIVHCHRHPAEAVPSYASLVHTLRRAYSDRAEPDVVGRQALHRCRIGLERAQAVRAATPDRFVDVAYEALVADPVATVAQVYDRIGRPLGPKTQAAMREWLAAHPRHQYGEHQYRAGRFGLSDDEVTSALRAYVERFFPSLPATG